MIGFDFDDKKKTENRLIVLNVFTIVIFFVFVCRLGYLQIVKGEEYEEKSFKNRIVKLPVSAPRGNIYDRNGKILANSRMLFDVSLVPQDLYQSGKNVNDVIKEISRLIEHSADEITQKVKEQFDNYGIRYRPVKLMEDASIETIMKIGENKLNLPGIIIEEEPYRNYPYGEFCGSILGYVGEISSAELNEFSGLGYNLQDRIGKTGIECIYESYLKGEKGHLIVEIDSRLNPTEIMDQKEPVNGSDVMLTIDIDLQISAEKALIEQLEKIRNEGKYKDAYAGSVVVLDPNNGEILALSTAPGYDPNLFIPKISKEDWDEINGPTSGLFNRAVSGIYPPGSIFKPIVAAVALEKGVTDRTESFNCIDSDNRYFKKKCMGTHGTINLLQGMSKSCNAVFYELALRLTVDELANMSRDFGLSYVTGINLLPKESAGKVPDSYDRQFTAGDLLNYAIGQQVSVTPLQMATVYGGIATRGIIYKPNIVKKICLSEENGEITFDSEISREIEFLESTWEFLHESLREVVVSGTASSAFRNFSIDVAGKTGTAEVQSGDDHAWFVGWAPIENPEIVVAVMIEHGGGGGSNAAPVARKIMEYYFKV